MNVGSKGLSSLRGMAPPNDRSKKQDEILITRFSRRARMMSDGTRVQEPHTERTESGMERPSLDETFAVELKELKTRKENHLPVSSLGT